MQIKELPWQICLRKRNNSNTIIDDLKTSFFAIPNPKNGWAADPFILEKDDVVYIFAELYSYKTWKGSIGYCIYNDGTFSEWKTIISDNTHFSFPYIYEQNNNMYLMPENNVSGNISLYAATKFPSEWKICETITSQGRYVDSIKIGENKILSYCIDSKDYYLTVIGTNIQIIDKEKCLRPAGKLFEANKKIYRPAQDCSRVYGGALNINEFEINTSNEIKENTIAHIKPNDVTIDNIKTNNNLKLVALHTYNLSEHYEVIDIQYERFSLKYLLIRIFAKILRK